MKPPPGKSIIIGHTPEGFPFLSWEVMNPVVAKVIGSLMAILAVIWGWLGHTFPIDFWRLLRAEESGGLDWIGLAITGLGAVFFLIPAVLMAIFAFLLMFRPRPERFILGSRELIYEPGSAVIGFTSGEFYRPAWIWKLLRGQPGLEVSKEDFSTARESQRKGGYSVLIQTHKLQIHVGRWLNKAEREWLIDTLVEWKEKG